MNEASMLNDKASVQEETVQLRSKVKNMARLLAECKEVLSQNVKERGVLLDRIKYLEEKSKEVEQSNTDVSDLKILQKAKKYKAKIRNLQKLVRRQKRDLGVSRYLNKRLFEHYLLLFQSVTVCQQTGEKEDSTVQESQQNRKDSRDCEDSSDESLVIPKSIKSSIFNKKTREPDKSSRRGQDFETRRWKPEKSRGLDGTHPLLNTKFFIADEEDPEQSEVSLPDTPPSVMLDFLATEKYAGELSSVVSKESPLEAEILRGLRDQKEMATKQMNALHEFHEALRDIKNRKNLRK